MDLERVETGSAPPPAPQEPPPERVVQERAPQEPAPVPEDSARNVDLFA